jgi:hypothetical protein
MIRQTAEIADKATPEPYRAPTQVRRLRTEGMPVRHCSKIQMERRVLPECGGGPALDTFSPSAGHWGLRLL